MKIGILSMQRVINFGSYLQAYALKKTIENLGHEVRFIDIRPGKRIVKEYNDATDSKPKIDKFLMKRIEHVIFSRKREKLFKRDFFHTIGIDNPIEEEWCDKIIIGSDEVFNCCQPVAWGFSPQLFGDTSRPTITYAASCGFTTLEMVENLGVDDMLVCALSKLVAISVRDDNTRRFVTTLSNNKPYLHLDPVFLFNWDSVMKKNRKNYNNYILIYAYDNRINDENEIMAIREFAKKYKKKIVSFGLYQRWCDENIMCSPIELISHFDEADYVITDTFHGAVISIKRNKRFVAIVRGSNKNKLTDLLSRFELDGRIVENPQEIEKVLSTDIDYKKVNSIIEKETKKAIAFLREQL